MLCAGTVSMALGSGWIIASTWLAAHRLITVFTELRSLWPCVAAVCFGGWCIYRTIEGGSKRYVIGLVTAALVVFIPVWAWFLSDAAFFHWKLKSLPPNTWAQVISDIQRIASPTSDGGHMSSRKGAPKSVQQLGLGEDFRGINAWAETSSNYPGVRGDVLFGYKSRSWGLWLGPEERLDDFCPGCWRAPVASKAYFFVGPRG